MKQHFNKFAVVLCLLVYSCNSGTSDKAKQKFTVTWSIYTGWQPWDYANQSGILKKWADKYGIQIELLKMDYVPSIEAYTAGKADACVMTNMEALDIPAASGVTSSAIILGDYSNGNDAILTRDNLQVKDLCGEKITLVKFTVSHYLLSRALQINGMKEACAKLQNISDADIASSFLSSVSEKAVITWNPMVMQIQKEKGVSNVFNSSQIPGEILDLMVVNSKTLNKNPNLGKALTGAWYEVMDSMLKYQKINDKNSNQMYSIMASSAGCSVEDYKLQLKTTAMFYKVEDALKFIRGKDLSNKMSYVRNFCFNHGLFGNKATSVDKIGIKYPNNVIQGDRNNIQLIFDDSFMEQAANK